MTDLSERVSASIAQSSSPMPRAPEGERRGAREQLGLAVLAVARIRRGALARIRRSRLLLWRYPAPDADELLLAPPDLRAHDPSFADEVAAGSFGLAGAVAGRRGRSPFTIEPPSPAWARELHGFGWLRHLDSGQPEDGSRASKLATEWIRRSRRAPELAWRPEIVGRRVLSWLSHAGLILDGSQPKRYAAVMRSLSDQITYLSTSWQDAADGWPRLAALIGLVQADLCIAGHDRRLELSQKLLVGELERQVPAPGGGHIGRNPWTLVEFLLDLLPLRRCYAERGKTPDPALLSAIRRVTEMLGHLRLGDGMPGRFNGMGPGERGALATVLAYDEGRTSSSVTVERSGYVRLERGSTVVLGDAGPPPPMVLAGAACAGCRPFELSSGSELL